ncbi:unnamed protein product [Protopolystoma xenopodis]|uniref:Uncharacterized protein n=1 Tax=Protopolystoma xenopodis TaxID=117903 RepID=A0A3S5C4I6_9PLAT|nr:unnamed protein product [Protopolystoma xenopodis]
MPLSCYFRFSGASIVPLGHLSNSTDGGVTPGHTHFSGPPSDSARITTTDSGAGNEADQIGSSIVALSSPDAAPIQLPPESGVTSPVVVCSSSSSFSIASTPILTSANSVSTASGNASGIFSSPGLHSSGRSLPALLSLGFSSPPTNASVIDQWGHAISNWDQYCKKRQYLAVSLCRACLFAMGTSDFRSYWCSYGVA